ncbi:NYN domain-containing protein [Nocardioides albidus]|uniref:NYN domain-containing protein n=1 Tax=Nocardioides albidus TaxID=1517589 RepID=A0A5C4WD01_9ACTN|nr:NYN domain-containing protein [Nocardioides albidus]TNM46071.1 NYN domain-containing protein [Nocardioides albidus]
MTTTPSTARLAVLIDADNTSPKHVSALLEELATYGVATVKRAYGDWTTTQLGGWKAQLNRHAIVPVQQFAYTTGKNSTDSALIIDAMDLLYSGNLDAFALVSSDSDFTRLATRLRESGKTVYGLGLRKTPQSLVAACDTFIYLEVLGEDRAESPEAEDADPAATLPNLQSLLSRAVNATSDDDGWAHLGAIGSYLRSADSSFDPRLYGAAKLITLVQAQGYLTTTGSGTAVRVGLKGRVTSTNAAAKKAPAKKTAKTAQSKG